MIGRDASAVRNAFLARVCEREGEGFLFRNGR